MRGCLEIALNVLWITSFFTMAIVGPAITYLHGVFFPMFVDEFNGSLTDVALIGTANIASFDSIGSILAGLLVHARGEGTGFLAGTCLFVAGLGMASICRTIAGLRVAS